MGRSAGQRNGLACSGDGDKDWSPHGAHEGCPAATWAPRDSGYRPGSTVEMNPIGQLTWAPERLRPGQGQRRGRRASRREAEEAVGWRRKCRLLPSRFPRTHSQRACRPSGSPTSPRLSSSSSVLLLPIESRALGEYRHPANRIVRNRSGLSIGALELGIRFWAYSPSASLKHVGNWRRDSATRATLSVQLGKRRQEYRDAALKRFASIDDDDACDAAARRKGEPYDRCG